MMILRGFFGHPFGLLCHGLAFSGVLENRIRCSLPECCAWETGARFRDLSRSMWRMANDQGQSPDNSFRGLEAGLMLNLGLLHHWVGPLITGAAMDQFRLPARTLFVADRVLVRRLLRSMPRGRNQPLAEAAVPRRCGPDFLPMAAMPDVTTPQSARTRPAFGPGPMAKENTGEDNLRDPIPATQA